MTLRDLGYLLLNDVENLSLWFQSWKHNLSNDWGSLTIGQAILTGIIVFILYKFLAAYVSILWESFLGRKDIKRKAEVERQRTEELQKLSSIKYKTPRSVWVLLFLTCMFFIFLIAHSYFSEEEKQLREMLRQNSLKERRSLEDIFRSGNN